MACPFFLPIHRLGPGQWDPAPRLPLGDAWAGECCSASAPFTPSETEQREMCNTGYARGRCARFSESDLTNGAVDAVRFSFARDTAQSATRVRYALEKDHFPVEHGEIGPATEGRDVLNRQARAFMEAHGAFRK